MILSFVKQKLPVELAARNEPQLYYVSLVPVHESVHPRVMHRHEDFLEIILIREGAGTFSIDGRDVAVRSGDLVIYNSTIIHDERTGPDKPLSWFCVALKKCPVARTAAKLPDSRRCFASLSQWRAFCCIQSSLRGDV